MNVCTSSSPLGGDQRARAEPAAIASSSATIVRFRRRSGCRRARARAHAPATRRCRRAPAENSCLGARQAHQRRIGRRRNRAPQSLGSELIGLRPVSRRWRRWRPGRAARTAWAPICAVLVVASYCGATSTTSPPTTLRPARPRRMPSTSRGVSPPTSGVPVPERRPVHAVDVERHVDRPAADDFARLGHDRRDAHRGDILVVQNSHPAVVREFPQIFGAAADADLDRALRVEHTGQHRLPERPAVMKLGAFIFARGVAVRIDMHHADRAFATDRLQDRVGDRVVAAHRQRNDVAAHSRVKKASMSAWHWLETEPALHRHVADVGGRQSTAGAMAARARRGRCARPHARLADPAVPRPHWSRPDPSAHR